MQYEQCLNVPINFSLRVHAPAEGRALEAGGYVAQYDTSIMDHGSTHCTRRGDV